MPAPDIVRVKLSSEAAGAVSFTPVVVRDMALRELLEEIAAVCGKDAGRAVEILRRGSLVSGATRFRWWAIEVTAEEAVAAMTFLPDPQPGRPFDAVRCTLAVFNGPGVAVSLTRVEGAARRLLRRETLWDALMAVAATAAYASYDYRQRADIYRAILTVEQRERVRAALARLRNRALAQKIAAAPFAGLDLFVPR